MERRDFIKSMFYTSAAASTGIGSAFSFSNALASDGGFYIPRTLVNILLEGGADLRHLIVPHYQDPDLTDQGGDRGYSYIDKFWQHRKVLYPGYASYDELWVGDNALYDEVSYEVSPGVYKKFGIHKKAQWLKQQFSENKVAIIPNVYAKHRRHDHAKLVVHTGDRSTSQFIYDRDGWGGRLARAMGSNVNVVPVSHEVSVFCNSIVDATNDDRLDQVVHVKDSRNFALPTQIAGNIKHRQSILARALDAYYGKRGEEIEKKITKGDLPTDWAYRKFFQHQSTLRDFGDAVKNRLLQVQPTLPPALTALFTNGPARLNYKHFGKECANLYDCLLARDILQLRIAYLSHDGWDTHNNQRNRIEYNMHDVFGLDGGLDTLTRELTNIPGANENMLYSFSSDFGRQLAANGAGGTDHGMGTFMFVIGNAVNGGVYGDMFPLSEIALEPDARDSNKLKPRFDISQRDIEGKTPFERVLYEVCEWTEPGTGSSVFQPDVQDLLPSAEADLGALFKPGYLISGNISKANTHLAGHTINVASIDGSVSIVVTTGSLGDYSTTRLTEQSYIVAPEPIPYHTFEPQSQTVNLSGGDVSDLNFNVIANLYISYIYRFVSPIFSGYPDGTVQTYFNGQSFVPGNTQVTVGGVDATITYNSGGFMWVFFPPEITSGDIIITTPTESYTFPVRYENLVVGGNSNAL